MENVQIRLKETRKRLGLTQVEIASKLGMKQATYQKIESGKNADIRISTLVNICEKLNVSADELLGLKRTTGELEVIKISGIAEPATIKGKSDLMKNGRIVAAELVEKVEK